MSRLRSDTTFTAFILTRDAPIPLFTEGEDYEYLHFSTDRYRVLYKVLHSIELLYFSTGALLFE